MWGTKFKETIEAARSVAAGWDGYKAVAPSEIAIKKALDFLPHLVEADLRPTLVLPSVVGGMCFTFINQKKEVFVEFYGDSLSYALFKEHGSGCIEPRVERIGSHTSLINDIKNYIAE